jgi:hypothetical protein
MHAGRLLEVVGNCNPREMVAAGVKVFCDEPPSIAVAKETAHGTELGLYAARVSTGLKGDLRACGLFEEGFTAETRRARRKAKTVNTEGTEVCAEQ